MNQVHKVIWSRVKNCYIVVSEITKRVGRDNKASVTGIRPLRALLCAMVIAGCMLPADADAAPGLIHAGTGATASGDSSIAYGYSAQAKKDHSIAQGTGADAEEEYALAMGYKATAKGLQSLAIGRQANAKGANSIAVGAGAKGYAKDGVAIGNNAESGTADNKDPRISTIPSNNGVAVGNSAKASGGSSVSVGNDSIGNGPSSVAIGNAATANDVRTTAIGNNAHAEGAGSLSIGREASALTLENATSTNPLVTGTDEQLDRKGVMAIGDDAKASGNNSIALGTSAKAGDLEKTRNADSVTLTGSAKRITKLTTKRSVNNAVAIGTESSVQSDEDIAVGYRATTVASKYHQLPGSGQVAIGSNSNTYGSRGDVAIGSGAETNIRVKNVDHTNGPTEKRDAQSVAIGSVAKAYGSQAVAVGADTRAIGNSSVAIGTDDIELDRAKLQSLLPGLANNENLNNKAPSDATLGSAALHDKPYYVKTASIGTASVALGAMSQAAGDASMAMGLNALAEGDASTAIGPLARSKGKKSIAMGVNANSQVDGGVALGADSVSNRQQTSNAYIPSGADTAQVNAIKATKGTTGAVSVGSDTVKRQIINVAAGTNDSDAVNVAQLKAVTSNASWTAQENGNDVNAVKNGSKVNFADGTNTTASVTKDASGKVTAVKYNLKKDVNLGTDGSLTINGNTYINKDGINAGNKQITNVASGGNTTTNAANIGDINRIVTAKDKYVTGGTANYQTNGDGTATLTGTNGLTANVTGLKNNYVTSGSVSNDGKTLTLERNDTGKVNVDLSKIFTEVAKEDYHLVANPEAGSQGKYKADSNGNMVLTVANEKGDKKQVTLTDIASKAQQNTNTTNITNINNTIAKGLNFGGDSGADINKKLGEKLEIKGGASAGLTDGNIGVVSDGTKLNVKLAKDVTGLNSVTAGTARMGVDSADHKSYVTGLDNRDWDVQNPVVVNGRAATEDQLKKVSDAISISNASKTDYRLVKNPDAADGNYSVANGKVDLKVEDKAHPTTPASTVTINNIASASDVEKLKAGFKVKAGTNEGAIKAGETLEFAAKDNAGVEYDPAARKLTVSVSKDPTFNSVTVGDVKINNTGINAGNKQITNVASGGNTTTNAANIGDINRIVTAKDKYVTGGTANYQTNGDGTATLTGTNGLTANVTGLKNNYVTSGSVSNDGKTLTLERNDTGKVNVDLSKIFTEVAKEDYHLVANPEAGSQGKYKADSNGNMVLTVANEKGDKKQVTLTDIASKAQQNTNTTNITNINNTIAKGLNFGGDSGADINKKLGEKLEIKGGASAGLTDGNIGVVSDGTKLNVKLKKDVDLGPNGSLTINGKTYVNKDGLNANGQKITNVADGTANSDAVNLGQLNAAIGGTAKATTVKAKDANVTVTEGTNPAGGKEYTVGLGDKVTLGTADKKIVVDGTSGKITAGSKVTIDGTTGDIQAGTVKVTGAGTVNELTNRTWDIDNPTVVHGQAATEDQLKTVSDGVKTNKTNITKNANDITNINTTIGKGLNFGGDSGADINKKLGDKLEIKGGASADLTDGNIGVVSDGAKLNVKLKKDVDLGPNGSLTINGKTYVNKDGLNANNQKITNVATGTAGTDAVNVDQLNAAIGGTAKATTVKAKDANVTVTKGTSAETGGREYTVGLGNVVTVGQTHPVTVNGDAGTVNGLTNTTWDIDNPTVVHGQAATEDQLKTVSDGVKTNKTNITKNTNDITNINTTIGKGLNFKGDDATVINKKLGEQLDIKGGADASKLSDGNIGVVSGNGALNVKLAKDVKVDSVTTGGTVINNNGLTVGGKTYVTNNGLNANNQKVTNVADGQVAAGSKDAVNGGQLHDAKNEVINKGLRFDADNNSEKTNKLGSKVTVNGDNNITTEITQTGDDTKIGVKLNEDIHVKTVTATDTVKAGGVTMGSQTSGGTTGNYVTGLDNKTWNVTNPTAVSGRAATEDQLKTVTEAINNQSAAATDYRLVQNASSADGSYTVDTNGNIDLTVEDKNHAGQKETVKLKDIASKSKLDDVIAKGLQFDANAGGTKTNKLGSKITVKGEGTAADTEYSGENLKTFITQDPAGNTTIDVKMNKNLKVETIVATGENGKDGKIGINGKDGVTTNISVTRDGKPGVDGAPGTTTTRIVYEKPDGTKEEVATLNDGMKYGGDTGNVIKKKLNEQVNVVGGITDENKLTTEDNLGVVSDGNNKLKVRLAKALKGLESITAGDTFINNNGITISNGAAGNTVSLTKNGLDNGGNKITNVAAGDVSANSTDAVNGSQLHDVKTLAGQHTTVKAKDSNITVTEGTNGTGGKEYTVGLGDKVTIDGTTGNIDAGKVKINGKDGTVNGLTNKTWDPNNITSGQAATEDQLKAVDQKITNTSEELTKKGMDFAGNDGEFHRNLGDKVTIKGEGTKAASEYSGENIKTFADANGNLTVKMDKNLKTETIVATGKNGKDGKIGINGKDGVTTNISVTRDGKPGVDGAPGATTTRIVYEKPDGTKEEVATLNDGMKYGGDTGNVIKKKLNEQVNVVGGITDTNKLTTEDNLGVVSDGNNNLKVRMAKDLKGLNSVTTNTLTVGNVKIDNSGINAGNKKITNVAAGDISANSTDAVNGGQLWKTNQTINNIGGAVNELGDRMDRVGAGAAALAALHPLDFDPDDKWDVAAGYGNYKDAHAVAVGAFYRPNEDTMFSVGGSFGGGENMVNAGVSVKLGQGNHVSTSKVAMAKEIVDLRDENKDLKKRLDTMEQKMNSILGILDMGKKKDFPDVPENHWAYEYVATLAGNGILEGYPDGMFSGDRTMTRYEFAAMFYRALKNGAPVDDNMDRAMNEFEPELRQIRLDRIRVDRISGKDNDRNKVERVRVNSEDDKANNDYRDVYGSHISPEA